MVAASPTKSSNEPTPGMGAVRGKERIQELDMLRGWAIFGMLLVNVWVFQTFDLPQLPVFRDGCSDRAGHGVVARWERIALATRFTKRFPLSALTPLSMRIR